MQGGAVTAVPAVSPLHRARPAASILKSDVLSDGTNVTAHRHSSPDTASLSAAVQISSVDSASEQTAAVDDLPRNAALPQAVPPHSAAAPVADHPQSEQDAADVVVAQNEASSPQAVTSVPETDVALAEGDEVVQNAAAQVLSTVCLQLHPLLIPLA